MLVVNEPPTLVDAFIDCPKCDGKGYVVDEWPKRVNRPAEEQMITCTNCNGNGEISKEVMSCCRKSEYNCTC